MCQIPTYADVNIWSTEPLIVFVPPEVEEESATEFVVGSGAPGVQTVQKPNATSS